MIGSVIILVKYSHILINKCYITLLLLSYLLLKMTTKQKIAMGFVVILVVTLIVVYIMTMTKKTTNTNNPKVRTYTMTANSDIGGHDIACFQEGNTADFCKNKCNGDPLCIGYNYVATGSVWGTKSGCCIKKANSPLVATPGITFYALNK
jgi:hypothetical protein